MKLSQNLNEPRFGLSVLLVCGLSILLLPAGCSSSQYALSLNDDLPVLPPLPSVKRLVAVGGFENKSTFQPDRLCLASSELLASSLAGTGYFRMVEWERMQELFDWRALSTTTMVIPPSERSRLQRILLNEYFVIGEVTSYNVNQKFSSSAISKDKTYTTTIRVSLRLLDAASGENLAYGSGEAVGEKTYKGGLAGGQHGSWDQDVADRVLEIAIRRATHNLIINYDNRVYGF